MAPDFRPHLWVKICANTNAADALCAAAAGADALGFVFAPSPRQVEAQAVRGIADQLPEGVERIGVFAGHTPPQVAATAVEARLTGVQLHGAPALDFILAVREQLDPAIDLIPTVAWPVDFGEDSEVADRARLALEHLAAALPGSRVLVDAELGGRSGGLGRSFDWQRARALLSHVPGMRILVAGGLTPENVREAVNLLTPWGVDVASGVERLKGKKDPEKIWAFLENARGTNAPVDEGAPSACDP